MIAAGVFARSSRFSWKRAIAPVSVAEAPRSAA